MSAADPGAVEPMVPEPSLPPELTTLHVLTTGGTIDKEYTLAGEMEIGSPMAGPLLEQARVGFEVLWEGVCEKDSLDLDDDDRELIRRRVEATPGRHVLITHGTDSMVTTADVLRSVRGKVVVLTGAILPARMAITDAPFNIGLAVGAMRFLDDGVYIAMSGRIFPAGTVRKNRAVGRFEDATEA